MPLEAIHTAIAAPLLVAAVSLLLYGIRFYQSSTPHDLIEDWRAVLSSKHREMEEYLRTHPPMPEHGESPPTPEERRQVKVIVDGVAAVATAYNDAYDLFDDLESARSSFGSGLMQAAAALIAATVLSLGLIHFELGEAILWVGVLASMYIVGLRPNFRNGIRKRKIERTIRTEATEAMGLERVDL